MDSWERRLADAGCRITEPRRAIVRVLKEAEGPLTPDQVLEQGKAFHSTLGLVTVYRTLNLLTKLNLARLVHRRNGCHAYLLASPGHHHAVICRRCGRAIEFAGGEELNALVGRIEEETGYHIGGHLLQLFGVCPDCQKKIATGKE
ncbi:MAG: Fur family transcriptional regulator [Chloroflexota bacterium]|nr:Fur family transcriptional regulator [Chloroflexota bacterium]